MEPVEYVRGLRRRWRVIAAAVVVGVVAAWLTSAAVPADESPSPDRFHADVLILDARGTQYGAQSQGTQGVPLTTMAALVALDGVSERAAKQLPGDPSPDELASAVSATANTDTGILTVTAQAPNARGAERIAAAFARALRDYLGDQRRAELRLQIRAIERQIGELPGAGGLKPSESSLSISLQSQVSSLRTELAVPLGLPILEQADAEETAATGVVAPSSRSGRVLIGAIVGLLGGVGLALVLERFDRRITTWRGSEEHLDVPLLAEIPRLRRARALAVIDRPTSRGADAFRLLASTILHSLQAQARLEAEGNGHGSHPPTPTIAVTSALRAEGKSLVAANLAAAFGELGLTTIVMSFDLRSPTLHRYLDVPATPGIVDAVQFWDGRPGFDRIRRKTRAAGVSVVPAGSSTPRPAAVLAQEEVRSILRYAKESADVVILDTPALLLSGDAIPLIQDSEAVLLVARIGRTSVDAADRVTEVLEQLGARVIGYTLNGSQGVTRGWRQALYRVPKEARTVTIPDLASTRSPGGR
jgi:Mrp family chromosome partitioning ATPase/capsular polysaccharide biosynthesis protein